VAQKPKYDAGKHKWAYDLLVEGFEKRIQEYLTEDRIRRKIREQAKGGDELYAAMLDTASGRKHFISMMTYWSIGQGLAVALRGWIEELIAELVVHPKRKSAFGQPIDCAYTLRDLKRYAYTVETDAVATAGETETEHSQNRTWDVRMRSSLVEQADVIARNLVQRHRSRRSDVEIGKVCEMDRWFQPDVQQRELFQRAVDVHSDESVSQRLICNLLVLEKPPGKIYAFRFASPRLSAERDLSDEKRNLLLLYGWLRQEKPLRLKTDAVEVKWAHLFSRPVSPTQEWYFHSNEIMLSDEFWQFIGVPYDIVCLALQTAGESLSKHTGNLLKRMAFTRVGREFQNEQRQFTFESLVTVDDPKNEPVASLAPASEE